jgi:hypothetical protein
VSDEVTTAHLLERIIALEKRLADSLEPVVNEHDDRLDAHEQQLGDIGARLDTLHGEVGNVRTTVSLGNEAMGRKLDLIISFWGITEKA